MKADQVPAAPQPTPRRRGRDSLRSKMMFHAGFSAVLSAAVLVIVFAIHTRAVTLQELQSRARSGAIGLALVLQPVVAANDQGQIDATVAHFRTELPEVAYVAVRGADGAVLAAHASEQFGKVDHAQLPKLDTSAGTAADTGAELNGVPVLTAAVPIMAAGAAPRQVGSVQVGIELAHVMAALGRMFGRAILGSLLALLLTLAVSMAVSRFVVGPLERLSAAAAGIAHGDLRQAVEARGNDEIAALATSFSSMSEGLRGMIGDLRRAASEIEREASSILATSTQQSAMSSQQASAINETSTTVSEIAQTSKQATDHADSVIQVAQRSEELSRDGQKSVEDAMGGLEKLAEQVRAIARSITDLSEKTLQIGDIIATVKDLAEQSNLLALNASIEAAKAGEHGRGFAVVAMEMRNLAEQSKQAAGEVRAILSDVQKGTRTAVAATEEGSRRAQAAISLAQGAGSAISGLAEVIRDSSVAARQIANNTRQQTIGVEQIVAAISELSGAMNDSLEGTRKIEAVAGNLTALSQSLSGLVKRYQV